MKAKQMHGDFQNTYSNITKWSVKTCHRPKDDLKSVRLSLGGSLTEIAIKGGRGTNFCHIRIHQTSFSTQSSECSLVDGGPLQMKKNIAGVEYFADWRNLIFEMR